jgi:UDPglucose--hexose-1-phosphate uridylyltransferase
MDHLPSEAAREEQLQRDYFAMYQRAMLLDYAWQELQSGERVVLRTQHWVAVVPYWAA